MTALKNGKIFGKFNIIDILVVVVLIAAIIGIAGRIILSQDKGISKTEEFEIVVRVDGIREYTVKGLEKKGFVFSEDDIDLGEITNTTQETMKVDTITFDGQRKFIERPGRYTAYVTIKAKGNCVNGTYYDAEKKEVGVGREFQIRTKFVSTTGEIISVSPIK